jgi:selenocysteine-specific elongation factor
MYVVATAGHVDHGKSTLVRALTGMEPDRWAEERRRGLTIDLGFAWTVLDSGREVSFVDVPGHERFMTNTVAGLGPVPVVCFVVAAHEGWRSQSSEHRDAIAALGIRHGLLVVTCSDRAPDRVDDVIAQSTRELGGTGIAEAPVVVVSAATGQGLHLLRATIDRVLAALPAPRTNGRVRLWVDRSFTVTGAGTVVTGTLTAGNISVDDRMTVHGASGERSVSVRGIQSCGAPQRSMMPVSRIAVNLRGISSADIARGDTLFTSGEWHITAVVDIRIVSGAPAEAAPTQIMVHVGTAAIPGRLRMLGGEHVRVALARPLPLAFGDRLLLRDPTGHRVVWGALVIDADPPGLHRRGDATRRAGALAAVGDGGDVVAEVARRGAVSPQHLYRIGLLPTEHAEAPHEGVRAIGRWWVYEPTFRLWREMLRAAIARLHEMDPLSPGLSRGQAVELLGLPNNSLLDAIIREEELRYIDGRLQLPGYEYDLGPAETAVTALERQLTTHPFRAPESGDLAALGLDTRALAAAEHAGRIWRLRGGVVLLPTAATLALRELGQLKQPFTTSNAREALDTTRRVVIPLLEYLDTRGWTRRIDALHREIVPASVGREPVLNGEV